MNINTKIQKENLKKFLLVSNKYNSKENFKKIDKIKEIIEELNSSLGEKIIDKIISTHKDYCFGVKFLRFLELHRKQDSKTITKILNLENPRLVESWYRGYPPRPIKTLLTIYFNSYHKINEEDLAYLFGWGFGDGGINNELGYYFVCGKKHDLLKIKKYLREDTPNIPLIIEKNDGSSLITLHNGEKRTISGIDSWILYIRDSSFCKLLYSFGLPKGNKVLQKTAVPNWIKEGDRKIKKAFLNSLFEGELQTHKVQYNIRRNKIDICPITFGLSKIQDYKLNLVWFLNEIRDVLYELNIKSSEVEDPKPSNIRKDGLITYSSRFYISISALNTINFSKLIDYPFNKAKKEALLKAVAEAKVKLGRMNYQVKKYKKALRLFDNGLSLYKISKELNIEYSTAKHWLKTKEHLPIMLNHKFERYINEV